MGSVEVTRPLASPSARLFRRPKASSYLLRANAPKVRVRPASIVLYLTVIVGAVVATAIIRDRPYSDKSIDMQVIIRLLGVVWTAVVAIYWSVIRPPSAWTARLTPWAIFFVLLTASALWSPNAATALVATISMLMILVLCVYSVEINGEFVSVRAIIWASLFLCGVSLILMPIAPDFVSMRGWSDDGFGAINRLRGITPSANAIGGVAAIGALLSYAYYPQFRRVGLALPYAMIGVATLTLILSGGVIFLSRGATLLRWALATIAAISALLSLTLASDAILYSVSRSGDTAELTNLTGRTDIWLVALEKIDAAPILGHGYMSAVTILSQDPRLFSAAAHTHNLFLEILFSSGLLGLIAFFIALASTIRSFLITSNMAVLAILLFVLIRGITEASPLNGAPNFVIYSLLMMIAIAAARIKRRIRSGRTSGTPNSQRPLTRHRQNQYGN